ncbi:MAG TPA: TIGR03084 family metal-binding protein [Frankiaceae bacterium]|nr:TIGR03084 family metal-binding protein [Frankiaceae bacterium]
MADLEAILADLTNESEALERMLSGLTDADWQRPTPAEGWTVAHQIAHLAWTDEVATIAAQDASAFADVLKRAIAEPDAVDVEAEAGAQAEPAKLIARWRASRAALADALRAVPPGTKLPWFGPPMSAASMATARSMETWAHGQDVADALGLPHEPGPVLQHVAHLGVRTRDFAYVLHDRTPPSDPFRVELAAPDGSTWVWGPEDSPSVVRGPAVDFCLLVTQRRHRDDVSLQVTGTEAEQWLGIAQAFAGPPGEGRPPVARG